MYFPEKTKKKILRCYDLTLFAAGNIRQVNEIHIWKGYLYISSHWSSIHNTQNMKSKLYILSNKKDDRSNVYIPSIILISYKKKQLFLWKWVETETMLSKFSQMQIDKYCLLSPICESYQIFDLNLGPWIYKGKEEDRGRSGNG